MLLRKPVQLVVNLIVLGLVLVFMFMGLVMLTPAKTGVGALLGKMASRNQLLSGIISGLDPVALAQAVNENPEFLDALIKEMGSSEESMQNLVLVVNTKPTFVIEVVNNLNPQVIALALEANIPFVDSLLELARRQAGRGHPQRHPQVHLGPHGLLEPPGGGGHRQRQRRLPFRPARKPQPRRAGGGHERQPRVHLAAHRLARPGGAGSGRQRQRPLLDQPAGTLGPRVLGPDHQRQPAVPLRPHRLAGRRSTGLRPSTPTAPSWPA